MGVDALWELGESPRRFEKKHLCDTKRKEEDFETENFIVRRRKKTKASFPQAIFPDWRWAGCVRNPSLPRAGRGGGARGSKPYQGKGNGREKSCPDPANNNVATTFLSFIDG